MVNQKSKLVGLSIGTRDRQFRLGIILLASLSSAAEFLVDLSTDHLILKITVEAASSLVG
jgi:hypothetical protein